MTVKTYSIGAALSAASGRLLCDFPELHELMTDLAGWPVMTHHMASQKLADGAAAKIITQVSWMPGAIENMPNWSSLPQDNVKPAIIAWLDRIAAAHGETVTLELGDPLPFSSPFLNEDGEFEWPKR